MAIPVATILTNVKIVLNDAGLVHWTQDELLAWISEGQIELVKLKPDAATKTVEHQLVPGAKQTNPEGCIEIIEIRQNKDGASVTQFDRGVMDRFSPNWMTTPTSSVVKQWADDPQPETFYVLPAQNAAPAKVVLTHTFTPPAVTSPTGTSQVRDIYQAALENYVLFRAFSKDSEPASAERAVAYGKAFYGG